MNPQKHLYRSSSNQMLGGVCAGLAEYFEVDPTIVRLITLILVIAGGTGIVAYIIAWIIIPEAPSHNHQETKMSKNIPDSEAKETVTAESKTHHHDAPASTKKEKPVVQPNAAPQGRALAGLILIALGSMFFFQQTLNIDVWRYFWPLVLIIIGLFIMLRRN